METVQERQPGIEAEMSPQPDYEPRYPGSGRLERKRVLISGGDSGIGRAVSILFAREGADLSIAYGADWEDEDAQMTQDLVEREGGKVCLHQGDIGEKAFCDRFVSDTVDALGGIDSKHGVVDSRDCSYCREPFALGLRS